MAMTPEQLAARLRIARIDKVALMTKVVFTLERFAKMRAPVKRGTLRRNITGRVESGGNLGLVGTNLHYAPYVHEGTRAHTIKPRNARLLSFKTSGGAQVYARMVRHPGTKPQPFLKEALRDGRGDVNQLMKQSGLRLFEEIVS